ncbi:proteasome subunit beta type-6-like [Nicotiana tomentosiformis]|uniref:proteasome subunit beta type-6-like n=1 Tax=Nicotiana tomentosiformis TaxID=4098 RepID=UPI00388C941A
MVNDSISEFDKTNRNMKCTGHYFLIQLSKFGMEMDRLLPHSTETSILVLGANSRTSTGMYMTSRLSNKITQLADNVYVCADDAQIVADYVRHFRIQLVQPTTVKSAANFEGSLVDGTNMKGVQYSCWGNSTVLEPLRFAIEGCESSYLHGFLNRSWREGMSQEEAEKLAMNAVSLAIARHGGAMLLPNAIQSSNNKLTKSRMSNPRRLVTNY